MWHCSTSYATLAPNIGPSRKKGYTATSQHYLFPHGSVGGAQQRTGVAVYRPPGATTCCWQPVQSAWSGPKSPPCFGQVGQQPKTPLQQRDGGSSHVAWWRVTVPGTALDPSNELHHGLAANPYPAHPDSPATPTPRDTSTSQASSPTSTFQGGG